MLDFMGWESSTGRLSGSRWWNTVNGSMMADLNAAGGSLQGRTGALTAAQQAWADFAVAAERGDANAQSLFWKAHQLSLVDGLRSANGYWNDEAETERITMGLAVKNVSLAAENNLPSDSSILGTGTDLVYPNAYPASWAEVQRLNFWSFEYELLTLVA